MTPDSVAMRWAARHHSVITRAVARQAGLTDGQIRNRVRTGRWIVVRPGVWCPAGVVRTPMLQLAAASYGLPAVVSHLSAAWLLGLADDPPSLPELTAERHVGHRTGDLTLHRTGDLARRDTQTIDGLRTTNAVRTCIDLGARLADDDLERLIERARNRRLVHPTPLINRFLQLARPGRDGMATVRRVLKQIDPALEPAESDLETLLTQVLRSHGVELPVRQFPVSIAGKDYRIDVCYPERRIAIESDGFTDHGLRSTFESDRERQNLLVLDGWTILRFTWRQICAQPAWVVEQVRRCLDQHPPVAQC